MLLRTKSLTKDYNSFRALDALDLTLEPGEVFGLLGPNGSGKTTALRLILGFLKPTAGDAWIKGHHTWSDGVAARQHVAYLPGELRLYENMSGRELIHFLCELRGQKHFRKDLDDLVRRFDIDLERPIANLSSGMKRKVALLQVLVLHADLIVMDEPTNALDPSMRDELLEQVRQARTHGQAVLFSSHVLTEVEQVCDRVGILHRGKLVHVQRMADLREGRLVQVRFDRPTALPSLAGLNARKQPPHLTLSPEGRGRGQSEGGDSEALFEYTGPVPLLLEWLAQQPVVELRMEPLGLAPIYFRYHGGAP